MTASVDAPGVDEHTEYSFADRELLVAIPHLEIVQAALAARGREAWVADQDPDLGLARLELDELDDDLLRGLYEYFQQEYAGWRPTIGKNRVVGRVTGSGELSWGGQGDPTPLAELPGWPPARSGAGRGARVAILDTAAVTPSPLSGDWLDRFSDVRPLPDGVQPVYAGHASFVAGLVLANAPAATVEVRQVLQPDTGTASAWDVARAIVAADRAGADVINLSLVCYTADGEAPMALAHAIAQVSPDTVVVAAAGNYGNNPTENLRRRPAWPAALPTVVAVGAADGQGAVAPFTPPDVPWIDVFTEGVDLQSTYLSGQLQGGDEHAAADGEEFGGFATWSGTSFAAGVFSGAVAAGVRPGRVTARESLRWLLAPGNRSAGPVPFLSLLPAR
jgi:membrane-anchored mycosin MYCP